MSCCAQRRLRCPFVRRRTRRCTWPRRHDWLSRFAFSAAAAAGELGCSAAEALLRRIAFDLDETLGVPLTDGQGVVGWQMRQAGFEYLDSGARASVEKGHQKFSGTALQRGGVGPGGG